MVTGVNALVAVSTEELLQQYVDCVQRYEATEHWGRQKRFARQRERTFEALNSRADGTARLLLPLRGHPDPVVRLSATIRCNSLDPGGCRETMQMLAKKDGPIGQRAKYILASGKWRENYPLTNDWTDSEGFQGRSAKDVPVGVTRTELEERVRAEFPDDLARLILELVRPAIGAWPRQLRDDADPRGSCLGGLPLVPEEWTWPALDGEPMLFVGHVNCAELAHLSEARVFPTGGIIAIFGEHDHLHCCTAGPNGEGAAVFYWPEIERLVPASDPIPDFEPLPRCGLAFYNTYSLPDPRSEAIDRLPFDRDQQRRYRDLHAAVRSHGTNHRSFGELHVIKLLGWPDLVQCDLLPGPAGEHQRLLLQLGSSTTP